MKWERVKTRTNRLINNKKRRAKMRKREQRRTIQVNTDILIGQIEE